jgi:hypothetical protein
MIKLYEYTHDEKVILVLFDNWLDVEKSLEDFKRDNPSYFAFIVGQVKGKS